MFVGLELKSSQLRSSCKLIVKFSMI